MQGHWLLSNLWELKLDSLQLLLGKRSGNGVLVGDVGLDVLLGTKFSCLFEGNESFVNLCSEDSLGGSEIVGIDIVHV